jgi:hypothetical protein
MTSRGEGDAGTGSGRNAGLMRAQVGVAHVQCVCEAGSGGTAFVWVGLGGLTWAVLRNLVSLGTKGGLYRGGEGRLRGGQVSRCLSLPHSTRLDDILNGCWPSTSTLNYNTHTHLTTPPTQHTNQPNRHHDRHPPSLPHPARSAIRLRSHRPRPDSLLPARAPQPRRRPPRPRHLHRHLVLAVDYLLHHLDDPDKVNNRIVWLGSAYVLDSPPPASFTTLTPPLVFTAGWAAAFGVLVRYFNTQSCGSAWAWTGFSLRRSNACGQWKAAQAFSFLSLVVWFATFVLGVITYHRLSRQPVVNEGPSKGFGRRSRV